MFLGMQNDLIAFVGNTKNELENLKHIKFSEIVETEDNYVLENGCYVKQNEEYFEKKLADLKQAKNAENIRKAKVAIENGYVVFKNAEFETNAQTVSDLTATMLILQAQNNPSPQPSPARGEGEEDKSSPTEGEGEEDKSSPARGVEEKNENSSEDDEGEQEENSPTEGDGEQTTAVYLWLSRDDKVVELTAQDFTVLGSLIADFKNTVWNEKYLYFKTKIEKAETVEELENIVIDYNISEEKEVDNDNL